MNKPKEVVFWSIDHEENQKEFTDKELVILSKLKLDANLTYISKGTTRIFYETFGFLDSRGGISYYFKDSVRPKNRKIKDHWYY